MKPCHCENQDVIAEGGPHDPGCPCAAKTLEELLAELRQATFVHREALKIEAETARDEKQAELAVMEASGQSDSLEAKWIRAWLRSDSRECSRILALQYPGQIERDAQRMAGDVAAARAALVDQVVGRIEVERVHDTIPVTVDADPWPYEPFLG